MKKEERVLSDKLLIILSVSIFVGIAFVHTYFSYQEVQKEQRNFALSESKILNDFMFIHRTYYQKLFIDKTIKLDENTLKALPAYSAYPISKEFSQSNNFNIKVQTVSNRARNPKNKADKLYLIEQETLKIKQMRKN